MGTSCTKVKSKKKQQRPLPPPFPINPEEGIGLYNPKPIAEIPGEILIRILEPEPSQHSEQHEGEVGEDGAVEGEETPRVSGEDLEDQTPLSHGGADHSMLDGSHSDRDRDEESKSDTHSVRSKSSQRSRGSQRSRASQKKNALFGLFGKKNPDKNLEIKGAKTAAHPSRNKTINDFAGAKDEKDFPTDGLEKIRSLTRDHLPLDILTRRTKILNNLKSKMVVLEKLELRHCKLNSFPAEFKSRVIRELNFSDNLISELPEEVFKSLTELEILNVSQNQLNSLPDSLGRCIKLQSLLFSRNQITDIKAETLSDLKQLEILDIMHNRMTKVSFTLRAISNVKELNLSMNKITEIEEDFFDDPDCRLEVLKLSLNPIREIGDGVITLVHLKRLDLRQTHIGHDYRVIQMIKEMNDAATEKGRQDKQDSNAPLKYLINQLVLYSEAKTPETLPAEASSPIRSPLNGMRDKFEPSPAISNPPTKQNTSVEPVISDQELLAAQYQVAIIEQDYDFPPEKSPLNHPLKELVLQVNDNLHIILTIATIEKIVKTGLESRERGSAVVDLPLTSNYFMERIAKFPSAINVLAAFKYQIKDDARRGLILQPTSEFRSARRTLTRKFRNQPVYRADGQQTPDSTPHLESEQKHEETIEELLAALIRFKASVSKVVEKEFNVPDFKAYHKVGM